MAGKKGLSDAAQNSRKASTKRLVLASMPTGDSGSISRQRTSTYCTPRSVSAVMGRSQRPVARLGRMLE
ncbi:hypothetical protein D3C73_999490 [compost metagenome]